MPRPIWKGHISFGLVFIPISLHSAEIDTGLRFHFLDRRDHARLRYQRINENTGEEVPWEETVRGFLYEKDHYVVLEEEDFKKAAIENAETIEIENFVDSDEVTPLFFEKPYFLLPENKGEKGYVLLREALKRQKKIGIAKVVIRSRQYLAAIIPVKDALVLDLMRFSEELRNIDDLNVPAATLASYKITANEMKIAEQLVTAMSSPWKPDLYHDDYREALLKFIEEKEQGFPVVKKVKSKKAQAKVVDFLDLMKKSIDAKKTRAKKPVRAQLKSSKKAA